MNAFELTMILAKLHANLTTTNISEIHATVGSKLFEGALFPMDRRAMELLLDILHLCDTKSSYTPLPIILTKHSLRKELHNSVLDSSTGLKAQRAT